MHGRRLAIWVAGAVCALAVASGAIAASVAKPAAKPHYPGDLGRGYLVFRQGLCYTCHTFKAAGPDAYGRLAVDFDKVRIPYAVALAATRYGLPAAEPAYPTQALGFDGILTDRQLRDVASFVARFSDTNIKCTLAQETPPKLACTLRGKPVQP